MSLFATSIPRTKRIAARQQVASVLQRYPLFIVLILLIVHFTPANAQQAPIKFKDFVFDDCIVTKNLMYSDQIPANTKRKYYEFNFYEPKGDTTHRRPLIIWLHGGGFKFGAKRSGGVPYWSKSFAKRGYVCAAINYRLSNKHPLKSFPDMVEACADAVDDAVTAIRFFKQNSSHYRVDTTLIILGGNSAGGMIALQAAYSSRKEMDSLVSLPTPESQTQPVHNPEHISAVISYWGAIFDRQWLRNGKVPIVSAHGTKDRVVPFNDKRPPLLGSEAIHSTADSLHIPNAILPFPGYGHELQKHFFPLFAGPGPRNRWKIAGNFAAEFLYKELFQLSGPTSIL